MAEAVDGAQCDSGCLISQYGDKSLTHFLCGVSGEGKTQDAFWGYSMFHDKFPDPFHHGSGLAATGHCYNRCRSLQKARRSLLLLV